MTLYSMLPFFGILIPLIWIFSMRRFRFLDELSGTRGSRFEMLDGLRGVLAQAVVFQHTVITYGLIKTGLWEAPASHFYYRIGTGAVTLFLMITGFLFWGKLIRESGRPRWTALYIGRLFRLGPMYYFAVLIMLAVVAWRTGCELRQPVPDLMKSLLHWLELGLHPEPDINKPDLNGEKSGIILAGVVWTIGIEWWFYFSLPLLAFFARPQLHLKFSAVALVLCLLFATHWGDFRFATMFAAGMVCYSLSQRFNTSAMHGWAASLVAITMVVVFLLLKLKTYGAISVVVLMPVFWLVGCGNSLFGFFSIPGLHRLGLISYSTYLLQGLVLTLVFSVDPVRSYALATPTQFWQVAAVCIFMVSLMSAMTYHLIEQPFIAMGVVWAAKVKARIEVMSPRWRSVT